MKIQYTYIGLSSTTNPTNPKPEKYVGVITHESQVFMQKLMAVYYFQALDLLYTSCCS